MQEQQAEFEPFLFTLSPKMQLKVESENDVIPAMLQIEYLTQTDGKLKQMCADQCLPNLHSDDLSGLEESCLAHCNQKLNVFFGAFYAQQAVI